MEQRVLPKLQVETRLEHSSNPILVNEAPVAEFQATKLLHWSGSVTGAVGSRECEEEYEPSPWRLVSALHDTMRGNGGVGMALGAGFAKPIARLMNGHGVHRAVDRGDQRNEIHDQALRHGWDEVI